VSIFGAIVKTVINVVTLPVTLPIAVLKDITDPAAYGHSYDETGKLIQKIKDEANEDD
jgi:hypothetical protein